MCGRRQLLQSTLPLVAFLPILWSQPGTAHASNQPQIPARREIVLVVGATSDFGQRVCEELLARGYAVRGLTRRSDDVKAAVAGTRLAAVEWVNGDLNSIADFAPALMKGVKKVVFAPLLASRAGLDPSYAGGAAAYEDIAMNRRIYSEAVGELARLAAGAGVDRFVLVSSAGAGAPAAGLPAGWAPRFSAGWRQPRVEPSLLNPDVVRWKLRGEALLRASGVPYAIVRAHSPPPRPWDDPDPRDYDTALLPAGTAPGIAGAITRGGLADVCVEALLRPGTRAAALQAISVRKGAAGDSLAAARRLDPAFPDWRASMAALAEDPPPSSAERDALARPAPPSPSEERLRALLDDLAASP